MASGHRQYRRTASGARDRVLYRRLRWFSFRARCVRRGSVCIRVHPCSSAVRHALSRAARAVPRFSFRARCVRRDSVCIRVHPCSSAVRHVLSRAVRAVPRFSFRARCVRRGSVYIRVHPCSSAVRHALSRAARAIVTVRQSRVSAEGWRLQRYRRARCAADPVSPHLQRTSPRLPFPIGAPLSGPAIDMDNRVKRGKAADEAFRSS